MNTDCADLPEKKSQNRKIGLNHFAFFRAYLQGLDAKQMWTRYLDVHGPAEGRTVRATIHWLRQEFVSAARRANQPRVAALLNRDPNLMPQDKAPALEDFARRYPDGFYTQAELQELFDTEFGKSGAGQRRMRLRERQLEALYWVEQHVVRNPHAEDRVDGWLDDVVAKRLLSADLITVANLVAYINGHGHRWWKHIDRLGEKGAHRVVRWLKENAAYLGVALNIVATTPRRSLVVSDITGELPKTLAIVPIERLLIPAELDGSSGRFRALPSVCTLNARNDYEAIQAWLNTKRANSTTRGSCRREAERFLLWGVVQKRKPLSSMTVEDCSEYQDFLKNPQPHNSWCGSRGHERFSEHWRPFAGPLSASSQYLAVVILKSFFKWLVGNGYLFRNSWNGVPRLEKKQPQKVSERSLSKRQWREFLEFCETLPASTAKRRVQFLLSLAYATGLRLSELANARTQHLRQVLDEENEKAWVLDVVGRHLKEREVPVPDIVIAALGDYLAQRGLSADPRECPKDTPLIGKLDNRSGPCKGDVVDTVTPGAIYVILDKLFKRAADTMKNPEDAAQFRRASTYWLRHTHGSHAIADQVPFDVVQYILGHESLDTTSNYGLSGVSRRIREMRRFTDGRDD